MAKTVNIYEAKTQLSKLVDEAAAGEDIIIARHGRPVARLIPPGTERKPRRLGKYRGMIWLAPDWDR